MVSSTVTEILFVKLILCKCWQQGSDRLSLIMEISVEQLFRCFANHLQLLLTQCLAWYPGLRRKVTDKIIYFYQKFGLPTKRTLIKNHYIRKLLVLNWPKVGTGMRGAKTTWSRAINGELQMMFTELEKFSAVYADFHKHQIPQIKAELSLNANRMTWSWSL